MPKRFLAQSFRDRAEECFGLAQTAWDAWSKKALEDLGHELLEMADDIESNESQAPDEQVITRDSTRV